MGFGRLRLGQLKCHKTRKEAKLTGHAFVAISKSLSKSGSSAATGSTKDSDSRFERHVDLLRIQGKEM